MIALDTNLLVYAHRSDNPFHAAAAPLVRQLAEGGSAWAIPWPCLHEFYSIVTHPRVYSPPSTPAEAIHQIEAWMESPTLHLLSEGAAHWPQLRGLLDKGKVQGALVHDARIAALCLAHGVRELWSADRDFSRFPALRARNPLVG
ncbi:TA system VapC family ribonuclease toxin [Xenophilus azovorans]|uniref:TA system VapC family ribonuclease toxin n=1 Tax=Xenophilus azovorans TaxID=151755 RepID=UPI00056EC29E|nr:TA system VapC family ribonuclease toxin [Xenophilus azovorans]